MAVIWLNIYGLANFGPLKGRVGRLILLLVIGKQTENWVIKSKSFNENSKSFLEWNNCVFTAVAIYSKCRQEKKKQMQTKHQGKFLLYMTFIYFSVHVSEVLPMCRVDRKVQWWNWLRCLVRKPCFQLLEIFSCLSWNFQNLSASGQFAGIVSLFSFHIVFYLNNVIILRCSGAPGIDVGLWSANGTWNWLTSPFSRTWFILTKIILVQLNPYSHRMVLIVFK